LLNRDSLLVWGLAGTQPVSWGVVYYAFPVLLVPMQRDLGWSRGVLVGGFTLAVIVSALAAPAVGSWLDGGSPRRVMTLGSVGATLLVLGWAAASSVAAYYLVWTGLGLAMAATLYEPAFTVLAKRFAPHHQRAITTVTLVAGLSGFVFQPLTSVLTTAHGWRTTLVILAVLLGAVTVPVHLRILPGREATRPPVAVAAGRRTPDETRDGRFWPLTLAFAGSSVTSFATSVILVAYLVDQGWSLGGAAFAGGTLAAMQLPGRLLFGPGRRRLPSARFAATVLALPGAGVLLLLAADGGPITWPAVAVLGMSQGAGVLLRATTLVDLYGPERIGVLTGISAVPVILARALGPLGAVLLASATGGYTAGFVVVAALAAVSAAVAARSLRAIPERSTIEESSR
jgi:MFS family permease